MEHLDKIKLEKKFSHAIPLILKNIENSFVNVVETRHINGLIWHFNILEDK